jgi:hypothetical protein
MSKIQKHRVPVEGAGLARQHGSVSTAGEVSSDVALRPLSARHGSARMFIAANEYQYVV